jgi:hypothetical protein
VGLMAIKGRRRQTIFDSFIIYEIHKDLLLYKWQRRSGSQAHDFCIEQTDLELENVAHEHHLTESELDMIERGVSRLSEMMRKREEIECTITDNSVAITLEG